MTQAGAATLGRADLARRAGVDADYIQRLVDLGILKPTAGGTFRSGDVPRVRLITTLDNSGVPLDAVGAVIAKGQLSLDFMDQPFYARFASLSGSTFGQVAARFAIPVELLIVIREAIGYGAPSADDPMREDELRIVEMVKRLIETGSRPSVVERLIRVNGESMRRVAEVEGAWWHSEVELPLLRSGLSEQEMLEQTHRLSAELTALQESALLEIYHAHHEHAATKNIINDIENALTKAGVYMRVEKPPAIVFLDITGYTRLTEERGDEAAADMAATLNRIVGRASRGHGGKPVKWLGDGVMFYFGQPRGAVAAALEMVEAVPRTGLPAARLGIHAGPVLFQEGDYFGHTVNVASRIADYARPGEVLVSRDVIEATSSEIEAVSIGEVELKGVAHAMDLFSVKAR